ncbi:hypothetical protein KGQ31_03645 [Patescibacteria group bacterium]|nr:hypothetical protein [Patescibacteria group bacterium]
MNALITRVISNKHTSGAAIVYCSAKFTVKLGAIWFPHYTEQFQQTADLIESAAVGYGLIMAGDSKPQTQNENETHS